MLFFFVFLISKFSFFLSSTIIREGEALFSVLSVSDDDDSCTATKPDDFVVFVVVFVVSDDSD